ncbi:hypothetical protein B5K03_11645 [Rhizobium phaseoli]|uniref:hypothetical protein n=1 Tax=Rhizobium phaseoli TaxID=396 RepID=UPI000559DD11|nr:hypothetical protein [Rhizobium phaseoli]PWI54093.1 hypothetical protein B5K03_11645 [Rhizobium phaseoli]
MKTLIAAVVVALAPLQVLADDDVIVSHFEVLKQCGRMSFVDKTMKELNTPEGKAIISVAAGALGLDPTLVGFAVAAIPIEGQNNQQDTHPFIRAPSGYTICYARPSNLNMGSGQYGIETHGDTTFNSTIVRDAKKNGLAMYMVVPCKRSTDTRVQSGFDVTFVKASAGWEQKYPNCQKTGSHPWLARNNGTTLDPAP